MRREKEEKRRLKRRIGDERLEIWKGGGERGVKKVAIAMEKR